jgi:Leucine-rich repeat (LRR) protein
MRRAGLKHFPEWIFGSPKLKTLFLKHNSIVALPEFSALPHLEELDLEGNQLKFLPDITSLTQLKTLNLRDNQIKDFPNGLDNLPSLQTLNVIGNPLDLSKKKKQQISKMLHNVNILWESEKYPSFGDRM